MTTLELLEKPVEKPGANLLLMEGALPGGWTPTSVTLPDDLSEQETDGLLLRLLTVGRGHQWWIGDTLNYRNRRFASQKYTFAMLETGFGKGYLKNMASVANRFDPSRRRDGLPWSYHADVSGLTDEEQNRWLDQCQSENWSRKELRKQLKAAISGYDPDAQPLEFASDEEEDAATESIAISAAEAGEESADLQAFMRDVPEPMRVTESDMNELLKSLSGTLIPQGRLAEPARVGEQCWVLLTVHRAGTPEAREDFGLALRVISIDYFHGEAYPLETWLQRVDKGLQDKDDYAGLVARSGMGKAWVLTNERMQVIYKSEPVEQTTPPASPFGDLNAPVEGGNIVTRILANDQLEIKPWVRDEWHVHDVRDNNLVGYFHTCNAGEGYYLRVEAAVNGGRIRLENAKTFAHARYILADYMLEQQRYTRPQTEAEAEAELPLKNWPRDTHGEAYAVVSAQQLKEEIAPTISCGEQYLKKGKMAGLFAYYGRQFVATGGMSSGVGGYEKCWAYEAVPAPKYRGESITPQVAEQQLAAKQRQPGNFYDGVSATYKGETYVLRGPCVTFKAMGAYANAANDRIDVVLPKALDTLSREQLTALQDDLAKRKYEINNQAHRPGANPALYQGQIDALNAGLDRIADEWERRANPTGTPAAEEVASATQEPETEAGFEQMMGALPDAMAAMGRDEADEAVLADAVLVEAIQEIDFNFADVFIDYPLVLMRVIGEEAFAGAAGADRKTLTALLNFWKPVIHNMARMIANPEGVTRFEDGGLKVEGNDLALLAKLAARRRPGQTEPISTAEYLHDMIAQKAEQAGVTLETEE